MDALAAAALGVALILFLLILRWKIRTSLKPGTRFEQAGDSEVPVCQSGHFVHRLCPHNNVVQGFDVEQKDSLDEHLDILARKLAEKESRLRLSKSKIRETQNEIQNLHAIDNKVRHRYREVMDSLRSDLLSNEKECRKIQDQIEWVSRRRAELKEEASSVGLEQNLHRYFEAHSKRQALGISHTDLSKDRMVHRGHRLYGEAAAELASNLAELQRGRTPDKVTEKSIPPSSPYQRLRKEPQLPNTMPMSPLIIKSSPSPEMERNTSLLGYHTPMS